MRRAPMLTSCSFLEEKTMNATATSLRATTRSPSALLRAGGVTAMLALALVGAVRCIPPVMLGVRLEGSTWIRRRLLRCMTPFQFRLVSVLSGCRASGTGAEPGMSGMLAAGNSRRTVTTIGGLAHGAVHRAAIAGLADGGTMCKTRPRHHVRICGPATSAHSCHHARTCGPTIRAFRTISHINGTDKG